MLMEPERRTVAAPTRAAQLPSSRNLKNRDNETFRVHLHNNNCTKTENVLLRSHGSTKMTWHKTLYYACQASSWHFHFVKKHYAWAHLYSYKLNMKYTCTRLHHFSHLVVMQRRWWYCFWNLFINSHFETHFQKLAFSGSQNAIDV